MNNGEFGLKDAEIREITSVFEKNPQIETVIIYGSRALGAYRRGSDIDFALKGKINLDVIARVKQVLEEETTLPYFFDIISYHDITNQELKRHIDCYGKIFYSKK